VPEADPVTDPSCDVDPLSVGGGPSVCPVWPPVVDDALNVADGLTVGDDVGLGEVVVCPCFFVAEEVGVAFGALVGDALGHPPAVPLGFGFALGELVGVAVRVELALTVGLGLEVGDEVPFRVSGVIVGLSVGLAGGVVVLGLADGLVVVGVGDGLTFGVALALGEVLGVGDGEHDVTGAGTMPAAPVLVRFPPAVPEGPAVGVGVDSLDEEVAPEKAAEAAETTTLRSGGTAASTTPTANTVTPMARAGRSMTSFQFLGRRGACCRRAAEPGRAGAAVRPDHACCPYLPSCAKNPAIASRIAAIQDWLA
jgi:hypothetical protein